jgi:hypothetical protein
VDGHHLPMLTINMENLVIGKTVKHKWVDLGPETVHLVVE